MKQFLSLATILGLFTLGCDKPARPASNPPPPPTAATARALTEPGSPSQAQPKLPTIKLWVGQEEMITEVARTFPQVQTGMMFRTNMLENEGMIFVFNSPRQTGFW